MGRNKRKQDGNHPKEYNVKRPAHPAKGRFFKTKGRKMVRRIQKQKLNNGGYDV